MIRHFLGKTVRQAAPELLLILLILGGCVAGLGRQAWLWKDCYRRAVVFLIIKEAGVKADDVQQIDNIKRVVLETRPYVSDNNNLILGIYRDKDGLWKKQD